MDSQHAGPRLAIMVSLALSCVDDRCGAREKRSGLAIWSGAVLCPASKDAALRTAGHDDIRGWGPDQVTGHRQLERRGLWRRVAGGYGMTTPSAPCYAGYRFPVEVISDAV
jgi:hypothetical protein